jgi:hypothetical protein
MIAMARPWDYPRWRRTAMQIALWLIFGGTLGLASLLTHARHQTPLVILGTERIAGTLRLKLPQGWRSLRLLPDVAQADSRIVAVVADGMSRATGSRTITVYCEQTDTPTQAEQYLQDSGLLTQLFPAGEVIADETPVKLGGVEAVRVTGEYDQPNIGRQVLIRKYQIVTCGILSGGQAVTIALAKTEEEINQEDLHLADAVAASVRGNPPAAVPTTVPIDPDANP